MTAIEALFSQGAVQRLGWALLHFVWQGAVVAGLLAVLLSALRRRSANARYLVACAGLAAMASLPVATMGWVSVEPVSLEAGDEQSGLQRTVPIPLPPTESIVTTAAPHRAVTQAPPDPGLTAIMAGWRARASALCQDHLPWIVLAWFVGVLGLSIWHLAGWAQVQRMRRRVTGSVAEGLRGTLDELAGRLGVRQKVRLVSSGLARVPMAIGWLRPAILLPASALTGLTPAQLESILAHELAHIRRYDYLVNLIQALIETVLFYHPAVWWVSRRIRVEREYCCDDLAVSVSDGVVTYARALAALERLRAVPTRMAAAASGGSLLARIRRVAGMAPVGSSQAPRWWAGACPIAVLLVVAITLQVLAPASSDASPSKPRADATRTYDLTIPDDWKSLVSVGKLSVVGEPFYGVPWKSGLWPVVRVNWSLKNLTNDLLSVSVNYRTESKQKGRGNTGMGVCYKLGRGEERLIDAIVPIASVEHPIRFLLRMAKPHRGPPASGDSARRVVVAVDPLPVSKIEPPTGQVRLTHGANDHFAVTSVKLAHSETQGNHLVVRVRNKTTKERPLAAYMAVNDPRSMERAQSTLARDRGSFCETVTAVPAKSAVDFVVPYSIPVRGPDAKPALAFTLFEPLGGTGRRAPRRWDVELVSWGVVDLRQAADRGGPVVLPPFVRVEDRAKLSAESKTQHFIFRYRPGSLAEREISKITKQREEAYDRLKTVLHMDLPRGVRIDLYPDMEAKALGSGTKWTPANTVNDHHIAEVYSQAYRCDAYHELAHIFSYHFGGGGGGPGGRGHGMVEGFAVYFEPRGSYDPVAEVRKQFAEGRLEPLSDILLADGHGEQHLALIDFLLNKDVEKYKVFHTRITHRPTVAGNQRAAQAVYGKSVKALEAEWHATLTSSSASSARPAPRSTAESSSSQALPTDVGKLRVISLRFEPIHQGKNVVHVEVENPTDGDQLLGAHVYTRSPKLTKRGMGWGRSWNPVTIGKNARSTLRLPFKIQGPISEHTWLRVQLWHLPSPVPEAWWKMPPGAVLRYTSGDLPQREGPEQAGAPVEPTAREAVMKAFAELRELIKKRSYDKAWQRLTPEYQTVEFSRFELFKGMAERGRFSWARAEFLELEPKSVGKVGEILRLRATRGDQTWTIDFVQADGQWKVDWIGGYVPGLVRPTDWKSALLPALQKRSTEHFDIYYSKGSTAERDIDKIARAREEFRREVCQAIGAELAVRICVVIFEDEETKLRHTGHRGNWLCEGNTWVEVYSDKVKVDWCHETTHLLVRELGSPPALFVEGLVQYAREQLVRPAKRARAAGKDLLCEGARVVRGRGQWIPLPELLRHTEVWPAKSRSQSFYPLAGAFVKFLIERRGVDRFLSAYRTLQNSPSEDVQRRNADRLVGVYGQSIESLEKRWIASLSK